MIFQNFINSCKIITTKMGNSSSCCCCCENSNVFENVDNFPSDPVSVITVQPSSSRTTNSIREPKQISTISDKVSQRQNKPIPHKRISTKPKENDRPQPHKKTFDDTEKQNKHITSTKTPTVSQNNIPKLQTVADGQNKQVTSKKNDLNDANYSEPQELRINSELLTQLFFTSFLPTELTSWSLLAQNQIYTLQRMDETSMEYAKISYLFTSTNKWFYTIQKIEKVFNPYLIMQYKLKSLEYKERNKNMVEKTLFHGTPKHNVDSICKNNFNWRLYGKTIGNKNGKGVNFASNAYFATHYGDKKEYNKVMFVVAVLVGQCSLGSSDISIPTGDVDTTVDKLNNPQVYVKYEDNSFYPGYIIHYWGIDPKYKKNQI